MIAKEKKVSKNTYLIHFDGTVESKGRKLKPQSNGNGYFYVSLGYGTEGYSNFYVHRLVAEAFIPNPLNKAEVNHKDGNKANNHADNLEWCDRKENVDDYRQKGRAKYRKGKKVTQYSLSGKKIAEFKNAATAARTLNCTKENISTAARNPDKYTALGFVWKYK